MNPGCSCNYAPCPHDLGIEGDVPESERRSRVAEAVPLIVGEGNPQSGHPDDALYPEPRGCSGWRLCFLVMQIRAETYLSRFHRTNLFTRPPAAWNSRAAQLAAAELCRQEPRRRLILLGRKVAAAFGCYKKLPHVQFDGPRHFAALPHPSGLNREWNDPDLAIDCQIELCRYLERQIPVLNQSPLSSIEDIPFGELVEAKNPRVERLMDEWRQRARERRRAGGR